MLMKVPEEVLKTQLEQERKKKELLAANKKAAENILLSLRLQLSRTVTEVTHERK